jgi:hypothetical protein
VGVGHIGRARAVTRALGALVASWVCVCILWFCTGCVALTLHGVRFVDGGPSTDAPLDFGDDVGSGTAPDAQPDSWRSMGLWDPTDPVRFWSCIGIAILVLTALVWVRRAPRPVMAMAGSFDGWFLSLWLAMPWCAESPPSDAAAEDDAEGRP